MGLGPSHDKAPAAPRPPSRPPSVNQKGPRTISVGNNLEETSPILIVSPPSPTRGDELTVPTAITFKTRERKVGKVCVVGNFNEWKAVELSKLDQVAPSVATTLTGVVEVEYHCKIPLPYGLYHYYFLVDGEATLDVSKNVSNYEGKSMHSIEINPPLELISTASSSPLESYTTSDVLDQMPASQSPPLCPPHLLQSLLNTASDEDPTILPLPNHVVLNHFYSLRRQQMRVVGLTTRHKMKFVTTVLYKPENS